MSGYEPNLANVSDCRHRELFHLDWIEKKIELTEKDLEFLRNDPTSNEADFMIKEAELARYKQAKKDLLAADNQKPNK